MLNNSLEEIFCKDRIAMFTRTSIIVERFVSRAKLTLDDQRNECCQCISNNKSSYLLTNVQGILKILITLLLKLDKYIFFAIKIPIFKGSHIHKGIFFQNTFKYIFTTLFTIALLLQCCLNQVVSTQSSTFQTTPSLYSVKPNFLNHRMQ